MSAECIFVEIINSRGARSRSTVVKHGEIEAANSILNRDDAGRNDSPTYVRARTGAGSGFRVGLRGRSRKFEGCREICETRGKTHKSGAADFGQRGGFSPGDQAQFNLGS